MSKITKKGLLNMVESNRELLSTIGKKDISAAFKALFPDNIGVVYKHNLFCCSCNHSQPKPKKEEKAIRCSGCRKKLTLETHSSFNYKDYSYVEKHEVVGNFQVFRLFSLKIDYSRDKRPVKTFKEVLQYWIHTPTAKTVSFSVPRMNVMGSYYFDNWDYSKDLKQTEEFNYNLKTLRGYLSFGSEFIQPLQKFGFSEKELLKMNVYRQLNAFCSSFVETAYTHKNQSLYKYFLKGNFDLKQVAKYWNSIKIALRHGIKEIGNDWFDHLDLLQYFKMDLNSPRYLVPCDFKSEHNALIKRKSRILEEERKQRQIINAQEELKAAAERKENYIKSKGVFFDIMMVDELNSIQVNVLKSLDDFVNHYSLFNHCVYTNNYDQKENSLILEAKKGEQIIATIEFNLNELSVSQVRCFENEEPEEAPLIVDLINKNVSLIKEKLAA